jgi:hypothetical protein
VATMGQMFRKIDHKQLWSNKPIDDDEKAWLAEGEFRSDALGDLKTSLNRLSIYVLDDRTNITVERLIAALAANSAVGYVSKVDYILFDATLLQNLAIEIDVQPGRTHDADVNACHRDMVHLTGSKLAEFGKVIQQQGKVMRVLDRQVGRLINSSVEAGFIDVAKLQTDLIEKLKEPKYAPIS